MQYLVYRSTALVHPASDACRNIVDTSIRNNARVGLTGFLHAEHGCFVQYLEGPSDSLWQLYDRLGHDPRHTDLVLLGHGNVLARRFGDWRMGYSEAGVLSLASFIAEVTGDTDRTRPTEAEAIYFLMAACQRIDLGIAPAP
ncbi:BLUF domain-containing protein [Maribius pontilimi]|uniref:BLUF domain-containing protein n=1 Tax=Palleronia pontilimi TaxID=1964209 RepID=A0A934MCN3_9RHOB|nr:BLUF domain-containing protein [Palleronia pontilimi]MBJ3762978.1 BLUF domain-containing protein [Palleronia pontilimi]